MKHIRICLTVSFVIINTFLTFGSGPVTSYGENRDKVNTITTAVPFLLIAPDSRAGALGDAGVATCPDANSLHWNPSKYAFAEKDFGVSISYTPWLRKLIDDINLAYLAGYYRLDEYQVVGVSLLYFSLGNIIFTDRTGNTIGQFSPNEYAIAAAYARKFSERLSGSVSLRYIYSNLTGGQYVQDAITYPGRAVSADVSAFYTDEIELYDKKADINFGLNISNIGSKISYTDNQDKDFIPINMRLGGSLTMDLDEYNSIMLTADLNKLMVPTMPVYYESGEILPNGDTVKAGDEIIKYGKDPNVSVPVGMFRSFSDAPGVESETDNPSVFKEEMREITYSVGLEYWYAKQFAIRAGYFHEHATKGNRKFFTAGLGLKYNVFGLDFAYLVPTSGPNHPLANTLRFTLIFDFDGVKKPAQVPD